MSFAWSFFGAGLPAMVLIWAAQRFADVPGWYVGGICVVVVVVNGLGYIEGKVSR